MRKWGVFACAMGLICNVLCCSKILEPGIVAQNPRTTSDSAVLLLDLVTTTEDAKISSEQFTVNIDDGSVKYPYKKTETVPEYVDYAPPTFSQADFFANFSSTAITVFQKPLTLISTVEFGAKFAGALWWVSDRFKTLYVLVSPEAGSASVTAYLVSTTTGAVTKTISGLSWGYRAFNRPIVTSVIVYDEAGIVSVRDDELDCYGAQRVKFSATTLGTTTLEGGLLDKRRNVIYTLSQLEKGDKFAINAYPTANANTSDLTWGAPTSKTFTNPATKSSTSSAAALVAGNLLFVLAIFLVVF